eukprot:jgi/Chrzof1/4393/Cz14g11140.t1
MPTAGRIGGSKGVGSADAGDSQKRKREDAAAAASSSVSRKKKPLDPAELEAQAKREAARQRVQQRTMSSFGLT